MEMSQMNIVKQIEPITIEKNKYNVNRLLEVVHHEGIEIIF